MHHRGPGHPREKHDQTLLVTFQLIVLVVLAGLILMVAPRRLPRVHRARARSSRTPPDWSRACSVVVLGWALPAMAPAVEVPMSAKLWVPLISVVLALPAATWLRIEARPGGHPEWNELLHRFKRRRLPRRDVR